LPTFTIVARDAGAARALPRLAAQLDGALAKLLNRKVPKRAAPTYVVLVPEDVWLRYLRPGTGITGEFVPAKFANYVLMQSSRDPSALGRGFFHEYSHWFLHTQFAGIQPLWFAEGLAEFVETASVDPVPRMPLPAGRAMSEAEALELVADIMLASGFNPERLPEVAAALHRVAPDSPAARGLLMRIAARNGQDAALEQLLAKIDVSTSDRSCCAAPGSRCTNASASPCAPTSRSGRSSCSIAR
jgi:hypothetical protein